MKNKKPWWYKSNLKVAISEKWGKKLLYEKASKEQTNQPTSDVKKQVKLHFVRHCLCVVLALKGPSPNQAICHPTEGYTFGSLKFNVFWGIRIYQSAENHANMAVCLDCVHCKSKSLTTFMCSWQVIITKDQDRLHWSVIRQSNDSEWNFWHVLETLEFSLWWLYSLARI